MKTKNNIIGPENSVKYRIGIDKSNAADAPDNRSTHTHTPDIGSSVDKNHIRMQNLHKRNLINIKKANKLFIYWVTLYAVLNWQINQFYQQLLCVYVQFSIGYSKCINIGP